MNRCHFCNAADAPRIIKCKFCCDGEQWFACTVCGALYDIAGSEVEPEATQAFEALKKRWEAQRNAPVLSEADFRVYATEWKTVGQSRIPLTRCERLENGKWTAFETHLIWDKKTEALVPWAEFMKREAA